MAGPNFNIATSQQRIYHYSQFTIIQPGLAICLPVLLTLLLHAGYIMAACVAYFKYAAIRSNLR